MPLEAISKSKWLGDDWLHTDVGCDNVWLKDATNLCHNTFVMSANLDKTAITFHLFHSLYLINLVMMYDK